jgi:hypothetical protein
MTPLSSAFSCQPSAVSFKTNPGLGLRFFRFEKFKVQSSKFKVSNMAIGIFSSFTGEPKAQAQLP